MPLDLSITKFQLQIDSETVLAPLDLLDNYIKAACDQLNASMDLFWGLPDERLLAWLNNKGPAAVMEVFAAHEAHATALNQILVDRGLEVRALIGARKPLAVDEQGQFYVNYPPVEPAPEDPPVEEPIE